MSTADTPDDPYQTRPSVFEQLHSDDPRKRDDGWVRFRGRYAPVIARFASKCGAKTHDVDDIIQDVMASFLNPHKVFVYNRDRGRFRGYLKTITVRVTIRRLGRGPDQPLDDCEDAHTTIEQAWNDVWEQELVNIAIQQVRDERQNDVTFQVFEQYAVLSRSAQEIARQLDISVDSVHQSKTRIVRALRERVQFLRSEDEEW